MLNSGAKFLFSQKTCSNQKGIYGSFMQVCEFFLSGVEYD